MPRFRNRVTGAVVSVREGRTLAGYDPVEEPAAAGGEDYGSLKVDDLRAEIERRNEGRDEGDQLSTEGKKADLVAVLEADDTK